MTYKRYSERPYTEDNKPQNFALTRITQYATSLELELRCVIVFVDVFVSFVHVLAQHNLGTRTGQFSDDVIISRFSQA